MPTVHLQTDIKAPVALVFDLSRSIDLHVNSMIDVGERAVDGRTTGMIELGEIVVWEGKYLGFKQKLTVRITAMDPPHGFTDELQKGAFKSFRHEHTFVPIPSGTRMIDAFHYESPFGWIGRIFNWLVLDRYVRKMLLRRNKVLQEHAEMVAGL